MPAPFFIITFAVHCTAILRSSSCTDLCTAAAGPGGGGGGGGGKIATEQQPFELSGGVTQIGQTKKGQEGFVDSQVDTFHPNKQ